MYYDAALMHTFGKALILGNGGSGRAAAALLRSEHTDVLVADENSHDFCSFQVQVSDFRPQVAIVSPGFSLNHPWLVELQRRGIALLSELELGWSRFRGRTVAVTGSNGKSTAVKWLAEALTQSGQPAVPCGNYGLPVSEAVMRPDPPDWLVIEVSSFQLETVQHFRPDVGVLLNVLPNHLDRHGDLKSYRALKMRLFENRAGRDTVIVPMVGKSEPDFSNDWKTFGTEEGADYRFADGPGGGGAGGGPCCDMAARGAAAGGGGAAGEACGVPARVLEASARSFKPLPHRLQTVAQINGVRFIDDSKATNLAAMCAALRMVEGPVHLIAGGRAKEKDLSFAKDLLAQRVAQLYLIGEASSAMHSAWGDCVSCLSCGTLEKAVAAAWKQACPGEPVLLSPGCTSFDQFCSFAERGEAFVRAVECLMPDRAVCVRIEK
jgi:UDP-N-acetylmuramoylalanine--D-glutamate ligase